MRYLFFILFIIISLDSKCQAGRINKRGFFEFNNYKLYLKYLDYCREHHIDGTAYFYLKIKCPHDKHIRTVVVPTNFYPVTNYTESYYNPGAEEYCNKNVNLQPYYLSDSTFTEIDKLSIEKVYDTYVDSNGILINVNNSEMRKAVIYKLLKQNVFISENELSGDVTLRTVNIKF